MWLAKTVIGTNPTAQLSTSNGEARNPSQSPTSTTAIARTKLAVAYNIAADGASRL